MSVILHSQAEFKILKDAITTLQDIVGVSQWWPPGFANEVLLQHSHTYALIHYLWLFHTTWKRWVVTTLHGPLGLNIYSRAHYRSSALIPDLKDSQSGVKYKKKKKKNAIHQMSLQNRKIFYFLYYTFSGLAKDQNSPLGHHPLRFNLPPISKSTVKSKIILYRMVPMMSWHLLLLWHELTGQKKGDASEMSIIKWIKKWTKECTTRYICEGGSLASLS